MSYNINKNLLFDLKGSIMSFDFYFTGVSLNSPAAQYLIDNKACLLLSQLNERSTIKKWIELFNNKNHIPIKLFIDSGAFSAWTKGIEIDVDEYIEFINSNKEYFEICASVDSIPGKPLSTQIASQEEVIQSCEKTWHNFLYMRSKMDDVNKLLYTFHIGEPWHYLTQALEYEDERGKLNYIALGGMVGKKSTDIEAFLSQAMKIISNSSNPNIKVHAFGMTNLKILKKYKIYSADSTTWVKLAGYGTILIKGKSYCLSDRQELSDDNILNKNPALLEAITKVIKNRGFTIEELSQDSNKRALFNMMDYQEWANNYKYTPALIQKQTLF